MPVVHLEIVIVHTDRLLKSAFQPNPVVWVSRTPALSWASPKWLHDSTERALVQGPHSSPSLLLPRLAVSLSTPAPCPGWAASSLEPCIPSGKCVAVAYILLPFTFLYLPLVRAPSDHGIFQTTPVSIFLISLLEGHFCYHLKLWLVLTWELSKYHSRYYFLPFFWA